MQVSEPFKTVLITGANGFIGSNLRVHLSERKDVRVVCYTKENSESELPELLQGVDFVFHLAGVNRPLDPLEFVRGNTNLTQSLCDAVAQLAEATGKLVPVVYASSIQASRLTPYGQSKRAAEDSIFSLQKNHGVPAYVFRLPNVFGKWCKPNYNSVIATFCFNIARGLPIKINDTSSEVTLVYVDDVINRFIQLLDGANCCSDREGFESIAPQYTITLGSLAEQIERFNESRSTLVTEPVGNGLVRALYSTYISYLPPERFAYDLPRYGDDRGVFVEMLKTPNCGQFSFFTVNPGVTRGSHYHHSKTEKFLVVKGTARMRFRHMTTAEVREIIVSDNKSQVVESVPGWAHDITNVGDTEALVMLWANEVFDRQRPDCIPCEV